MGINVRPDYRDHWKKDIFLRSDISHIISQDKFYLWNRFLHLGDNKIQGDNINMKFQKFYDLLHSP